ncbi:MAG: hypothetical protein JW883_11415 [Deltaproteobacteria bacterium]|nr:hypothetical protein [Deltaproteobacteria bacterium]
MHIRISPPRAQEFVFSDSSIQYPVSSIRKISCFFLCLLACHFFTQSALSQDEFSFDLSEIEKKSYHLGGYAEFRPILFGLDRDASLYKLKFYNRDEGRVVEEYDFALQLEGSYEKGVSRFFVRTNSDLEKTYEGWSGETTAYEAYLSVKPSFSLTIDAGKKTLKWGKGYAWNPVAFVDRPKNPDDPALNLEGFIVASADYTRSLEGPLKTFSFTPVLIPVCEEVNDDFGDDHRFNFAGKLYFLYYDTDIDLMFLAGDSKTPRYGFDFSRNILANLEIHGEFAYIKDYKKSLIDQDGTTFETESHIQSYLVGFCYLSVLDTTYILEYYHNGTGLTKGEMKDFFSYIDNGYDLYLSTGNDVRLKKASNLSEGRYGKMNPMRDYLYLRISQKEPCDILYFTPSMTWIFNVNDQSFSLSPELLYTGITNLELRLKGAFIAGERLSEYGEKQNDYKVELRARYYF